jgi:hypothetical protein
MEAKDYTFGGELFVPFNRTGYTVIRVLPELTGKEFDDWALGMIHSLRPYSIRTAVDGVQLTAILWRVTVWLKIDNRTIRYIEQEVEVGLPKGCHHGEELSRKFCK